MKAPILRRLEALEAAAPTAATGAPPPTLFVRFVGADREASKALSVEWQGGGFDQRPDETEAAFMGRAGDAVRASLPVARRNVLVLVRERVAAPGPAGEASPASEGAGE